MKPYEWTFLFFLASTVSQIVGETEILLSDPPAQGVWDWQISPSKTEGAGWIPPSFNKVFYAVCDIQTAAKPSNWLITPFIPLKGAKLVDIKMGYTVRNCPSNAGNHCKTYFGLYVYHTDNKMSKPPDPALVQYDFVGNITPERTRLPDAGEVETYLYHNKLVPKALGIYLAFKDEGVCTTIRNFTVGYKYCPERGKDLVTFSRTIAPANDSDLVEIAGRCSTNNSVSEGRLSGVCLSSGEWNTNGSKCVCTKGYELAEPLPNSFECKECPNGSYKSTVSNTKCLSCPEHSVPNQVRTSCRCEEGFYAVTPMAPCRRLPRAPLNASTSYIGATHLTINWIPRNNVSSLLRYTLDCFGCKSCKNEECNDPCGSSVKFIPGQDNISDLKVTVHGLQPGSYYLFRVYSINDLNQQQDDRDKWNYVTVCVHTNEEFVAQTTAIPGGGFLTSQVRMALFIGIPIVLILVIAMIVFICVCRKAQNGVVERVQFLPAHAVEDVDEVHAHLVQPESNAEPFEGDRLYMDIQDEGDRLYMDIQDIPCFELDRNDVTFMKLLGSGNFGEVYKASMGDTTVAVKCLKGNATPKDKQDMVTELDVMKGLNPHPYVVKLIGCCSHDDPLWIILEYLPYGDLLGFLRKSRGLSDIYNSGEKRPTSRLTAEDLLSFAWMIADGMSYLARMRVVHRDLAARNILVGENKVCKISDFGLARDVNIDVYMRTSQARLPVKWTPPESLFRGESSTMSDTWSYGIVLWEVFTIGDSPYPGIKSREVASLLERGYRMPQPIHISDELYSIMSECWSEKPEDRPTFQWICTAMTRLMKDHKTYINLDDYNDEDYLNFDMVDKPQ